MLTRVFVPKQNEQSPLERTAKAAVASGEISFSVKVGGTRTVLEKVQLCREVCLGIRLGKTGRVEAVRLDQG